MDSFSDLMDKIDRSFIINSKILNLPINIKVDENQEEYNKDKELIKDGKDNTLSRE